MNYLFPFPNCSPFDILQFRPCSNNDPFSSYQEERWSLMDLMWETLTDSHSSPSSMKIGGGDQNQNLQQVLPVGGELVALKEYVSSESESVNGNSVGNVGEPLMTEEGAITSVTSPVVVVKAFGQRSSAFRGVTKHRWTGRYEAHLWDNTCRVEGQKRKGRQGM